MRLFDTLRLDCASLRESASSIRIFPNLASPLLSDENGGLELDAANIASDWNSLGETMKKGLEHEQKETDCKSR